MTGASHKPDRPAAAPLRLPPLYPIIDIDLCRLRGLNPAALAGAYLAGGARLLQIRQKGRDGGGGRLLGLVREVLAQARPAGIIVCGAMIYGLGWTNWLRLGAWLAVGLVLYFGYGKNHSKLATA